MKEILMPRGFRAIVDDDDYADLSQYSWCVTTPHGHRTRYAATWMRGEAGTRKRVSMHRHLLAVTDHQTQVDHVNHDGLDNRRANLRKCSPAENGGNRRKQLANASSKFKGVYFNKADRLWQAYIKVRGARFHLGQHAIEEDAARAYDNAAAMHFGSFAYLNFPKGVAAWHA